MKWHFLAPVRRLPEVVFSRATGVFFVILMLSCSIHYQNTGTRTLKVDIFRKKPVDSAKVKAKVDSVSMPKR